MVRVAGRWATPRMNACGATRLLVPGVLIGLGVSSVTGSDLIGWAVLALALGALVVVRRIRGIAASCAVAPPDVAPRPAERPVEQAADASASS